MHRLISMMLSNFFEYQIECAVVGGQALFYSGKTEKALKALKKAIIENEEKISQALQKDSNISVVNSKLSTNA